jgi:short-subunit dehydrogenase
MQIDNTVVLITGASAGIGREFALLLARRARALVLIARRSDRLEALHAELSEINPGLEIHLHPLDLNDVESIAALPAWLNEKNLSIDLLINNAGLGDMGAFASADPKRLQQMANVNISALTQLTRALLPDMIVRGRGGILNVSSSAGFIPIPGFAVYAATKAYVNSFTEALRAEVIDKGISVSALCPGPVHTEFSDVAQRPGERPQSPAPEFVYVAAADVAAAGLRAIETDQPVIIPGRVMKIAMFISRITPMWLNRRFSRFAGRRRGGAKCIEGLSR